MTILLSKWKPLIKPSAVLSESLKLLNELSSTKQSSGYTNVFVVIFKKIEKPIFPTEFWRANFSVD